MITKSHKLRSLLLESVEFAARCNPIESAADHVHIAALTFDAHAAPRDKFPIALIGSGTHQWTRISQGSGGSRNFWPRGELSLWLSDCRATTATPETAHDDFDDWLRQLELSLLAIQNTDDNLVFQTFSRNEPIAFSPDGSQTPYLSAGYTVAWE